MPPISLSTQPLGGQISPSLTLKIKKILKHKYKDLTTIRSESAQFGSSTTDLSNPPPPHPDQELPIKEPFYFVSSKIPQQNHFDV